MKVNAHSFFVLIIVIVFSLVGHGAVADTAVNSKVISIDGATHLVLSNSHLMLTFVPERGGRCISFRTLDNDEELIADGDLGMFVDHWAKYPWPSGLMHLPYQYELVKDGKTRAGIRLWVTVPAKGGGRGTSDQASSLHRATPSDLIGLVVSKTIWLNATHDVIEVEQAITNPTKRSRSVSLYIQHNFNMNGQRLNNTWYLPSREGVSLNIQPNSETGNAAGVDWVRQPTAGWMAVRNRKTNRGLLFAFDYNYLDRIYTCGTTAEWFMQSVPIGPGKTFKTSYVVKPINGFDDFAYGSKNIVANLHANQTDREIRIYHDLAAVGKNLTDLKVTYRVVGWKSKQLIVEKTIDLSELGFDKIRQAFSFEAPKDSDGVVVKVVVQSKGIEDRYEYYYAGGKNPGQNSHTTITTEGGMPALAGTNSDAYFLRPPRKVKDFDKPDFSQIARPTHKTFKILSIFGLYTNVLNLDDALAQWKNSDDTASQITWINCPPNAIEWFPGTYDELFAYRAVVLSDVNYRAIGDIGFEMLCDYVQQGGNLLVIGGPYALGNGEFEGTRFLEMLPVNLSGPFDLKWAGKNKSWPLRPAKTSHPVVQGVDFSPQPYVYWHHFVTAKPGAEIVLLVGQRPALILDRYGKGKVAVLTLSPTGSPGKSETPWWEWEGWSPLVQNIFSWLDK